MNYSKILILLALFSFNSCREEKNRYDPALTLTPSEKDSLLWLINYNVIKSEVGPAPNQFYEIYKSDSYHKSMKGFIYFDSYWKKDGMGVFFFYEKINGMLVSKYDGWVGSFQQRDDSLVNFKVWQKIPNRTESTVKKEGRKLFEEMVTN